jgi:hypothetical protein
MYGIGQLHAYGVAVLMSGVVPLPENLLAPRPDG